jgi:pyridoxine/pyridoxamine 5'-phosphate oxidase
MTSPDRPPSDPLGLLRRWLDEAAAAAVPGDDPSAVVLATVNADGQPTTRAIEIRDCSPRGLVFFANLNSRKGRDLRASPAAAATWWWPSMMRQVNLSGPVEFTSDEESDRSGCCNPEPARSGRPGPGAPSGQAGRLPSSLVRPGRWLR